MPGISVFGDDIMIIFWPLAGPDPLKVRHLVVETLIDRYYSEPYTILRERSNYWAIQGVASYFEKSEFRHGRAVFSPLTNEHILRAAAHVAGGKAKDFAEFTALNRDAVSLGRISAAELLELISGEEAVHTAVEMAVVQRESTAAPAGVAVTS